MLSAPTLGSAAEWHAALRGEAGERVRTQVPEVGVEPTRPKAAAFEAAASAIPPHGQIFHSTL